MLENFTKFWLQRPSFHDHFLSLSSSVASSICQEGQSERTFPTFTFSSQFFLFFPDFSLFFPIFGKFFAVRGGTLPSLMPQCGYTTELVTYLVQQMQSLWSFTFRNRGHKFLPAKSDTPVQPPPSPHWAEHSDPGIKMHRFWLARP